MTKMLKYLGAELHRYYSVITQTPMPWRVIDKLESLQEVCEERDDQDREDGRNRGRDGGALDGRMK